MTVPLTLSSVPNVLPYIQYVATNGQTVYPYPFPITLDSDLVVIVNGVTYATDAGYTLSGQGNPTGGNVTLTVPSTSGDIITLFRNVAIQRITQIGQNSGFSSTAFNAEFNQIYLIMQQLEEAITLCLQIPNTNNPAPTTTLLPANYANKYLSFDANGNPLPAVLTSSGSLTQTIIAGLLNAQTAAEVAVGSTPLNFVYNPGQVQRYYNGAGNYDAAIAAAIAQANHAGGSPLNLLGATLAVVGNVANLHTTPKIGTGAITRGGKTFYVNIGSSQTNTLFKAIGGNDSNDGIDTSFPFLTWQAAVDAAFKNYGPFLGGTWNFTSGAGTFTDQLTMPPAYQSANTIQINGVPGALPFVPMTIMEGGGTLPQWFAGNGYNNVQINNILWQNYRSSGNGLGCVVQEFSQLILNNCWGINNDLDFKNQAGRTITIGGVFQGGTAGCTLISSGETHTIGSGSTLAIPGNLAVTGVSGDGVHATITFASVGTPPIVGGYVAVTGFTGGAAGYNGLYAVTSSSATSITYLNATTAATAGTPFFAYNIGCANYGTTFYGKSSYGLLAQENATGHLDNSAVINCVVGIDMLVNSRFNCNTTLFQSNVTCAMRGEEGGDPNDNGCNIGTSNGTTKLLYGPSGEITRMGKWTMLRKQPIDATFITSSGTQAGTVAKTYLAAIDAAGFNTKVKKFIVRIAGTMTGTNSTKNLTVNLDGAQIASCTTQAAADNGAYIMEVHCLAFGTNQQSFTGELRQHQKLVVLSTGADAVTPTNGDITILWTVNTADSISIRTVEIFCEGGA